jgi:hypothetical protein
MNAISRAAVAALLLALAAGATKQASEARATGAAPASSGIALVELFTSEGCSSCPPADALLERVVRVAEASGRHVLGLSLHVDYWDHLGWRDRFSSADYTRRQSQYARRFDLKSIYTPEIVVNGDGECVGSNAGAVQGQIDRALSHPSQVTPALSVAASGQELRVRCDVPRAPRGSTLSVAWVQSQAVSSPDAGENGGRTLRHANVVRDLRTVDLGAGFHEVIVLHRAEAEDGEVVGWVQASGQGSVLGAEAVAVRAAPHGARSREMGSGSDSVPAGDDRGTSRPGEAGSWLGR